VQRQKRGYRTIHFYGGDDVSVFLLSVYGKGTIDNLTKAERNELPKVLSQWLMPIEIR